MCAPRIVCELRSACSDIQDITQRNDCNANNTSNAISNNDKTNKTPSNITHNTKHYNTNNACCR